ncbi:ribosomal protein L4 [Candidatus Phytoplasma pruni]|uniref:Large ribosomal subunit protein uL4 n=1 Tax=Candidatus Phytoplasma pruni TaxID=479893 RepID=A0A0M1N006_9MOLU|nr:MULTISPECIES: 50S ribosomal protein L4 [16SrIII (X-disease group)]KOR75488.1 ribosomal protein L4 [Candidatus Phytoplasma pruni]MCQ9618658.1 50S ribosomal protein L4 [Candidatus Phytoplasma pruni]MDW3617814.1 50S ribosomal protein L4 [Candidatus Phytoplasma pruni]WEK82373.1 MAG: 50S ribosomal protein L4 [Candidatus Phytoplasma pruni]
MPKCNVFDQNGKMSSEIVLLDQVFGIKPNQQVLYDVVNKQRAAMRQGTHSTKNRSAVSGGGRKPWAQKGTGNSRQGTNRSPLWRKGGVAFGPKPRDYDFKMNWKVRRLALNSALSLQTQNNNLTVVESLKLETSKTKEFQKILKNLQITEKVLVIVTEITENLMRSTNNLPQVTLESVSHVSVYQILNAKCLFVTKGAIAHFEEVLNND